MRVLYYVGYPLAWAPGGHAIQIRETAVAARRMGIEVAWLHHDSGEIPPADIVHYWELPPSDFHWTLARNKGARIIVSYMNPVGARRSPLAQYVRGALRPVVRRLVGRGVFGQLGYGVFREGNAFVTLNPAERDYICRVYGADRHRCIVIPNGVREEFFAADSPVEKEDELLYVASVRALKNQLAVARAAKEAGVRVVFVGKALPGEEAYANAFQAELDGQFATWLGGVDEAERMAQLMRRAKGLFLASEDEAQGAVLLEALASGIPVMASDHPCIKSFFGSAIRYCSPPGTHRFVRQLQEFSASCSQGLKQAFPVMRWSEVGRQVAGVYRHVLAE